MPRPRLHFGGIKCGVLRRTSLMQCAARSSGRVMLNEPRKDFASAVRELATTTASRIFLPAGTVKGNQRKSAQRAVRPDRISRLLVQALLTPPRPGLGLARRTSCLPPPNASAAVQVPRVRRALDEILRSDVDFIQSDSVRVPHRAAPISRKTVAI